MMGMTCTTCFRQTDIEPDFGDLDTQAIVALCKSWKCSDCLDSLDREAIERGEPPPSGAWNLVEQELNDCYADVQDGGDHKRHEERIAMLLDLLAMRDAEAAA